MILKILLPPPLESVKFDTLNMSKEEGLIMNFVLNPSLEHITLVKIAVTLWNQKDIKVLMKNFTSHLRNRRAEWQKVESKVLEKVSQLSQPESLKEKIAGFIKPIGFQMLQWLEFYWKNCHSRLTFPKHFYWTPEGTIDSKKTAELLVRDTSLPVSSRYCLACISCLEDDLPELWNNLPEANQYYYFSENYFGQQTFYFFWACIVSKEMHRLERWIKRLLPTECSPWYYAFSCAAGGGNIEATKYFLKKLTPEEKENTLVTTAILIAIKHCYHYDVNIPEGHYSDVVCLLLSEMNREQQMKIIKNPSRKILECFLQWPWQMFFLETANHMQEFLTEKTCDVLLEIIMNKVIDGYKDFNYRKLYNEFLQLSPNTDKKYFIDNDSLLL